MSRYYDEDDSLPLRSAPPQRYVDREDVRERAPMREAAHRDKEITLSTGIVLAIFLALTLICAIFFGFGYSMGRKSAQPATASTEDGSSSTNAATFSGFKPAAGNTTPPAAAQQAAAAAAPAPRTAPGASETASASDRTSAAASAPIERTSPSPATVAAASASNGGSVVVQVAAVSHQEDADVLTSALRRRGYNVTARADEGDHLIHVQLGPFTDRKEADAMRQKLLADGYNAFLK